MEDNKLLRMRTIPQAIEYLKEKDPDSCVNEWWLRTQLKRGAFPYHKAGKRFLIDLDALEQFLANPPAEKPEEDTQTKIRRVSFQGR